MRASALLTAAAISGVNSQTIVPPIRGCLVPSTPAPAEESQLSALTIQNNPQTLEVDVNFHIVTTEATKALVTDKIVTDQWHILRDAYAKQSIHLRLNSTSRVVDDRAGQFFLVDEGPEKGFVSYDKEKEEWLLRNRRGGYDALNLYFHSPYLPGASGFCSWPEPYVQGDVRTLGLDGCQVSVSTMPGITVEEGGSAEWNAGHIAIHESGHWFGLNHTFAGGCNQPGDFVSDTPAHGIVYDCPVGSDTCPNAPGLDPIHNYMGYTNDTCTSEFTEGQRRRMLDVFSSFRRPNAQHQPEPY